MVEDNVIREFQGEYRFLSNFWYVDVELDGVVYPTLEHAYQAAKTDDPKKRDIILHKPTPGSAKREARWFTRTPGWEQIKVDVMLSLLRKKFSNPKMKERLLATGDKILQEGNDWGDNFWGIEKRTGKGKNMLGKLIMTVRDEIRLTLATQNG